jgi:hypothetical protein
LSGGQFADKTQKKEMISKYVPECEVFLRMIEDVEVLGGTVKIRGSKKEMVLHSFSPGELRWMRLEGKIYLWKSYLGMLLVVSFPLHSSNS